MSELQTDEQACVGTGDFLMLCNQDGAHAGKRRSCMFCDQELVWIRAPFVADGDCLPAPDKLRTTPAKALPAAESGFSWTAVGRAVPALHGLHGDPVSDFNLSADKRFTQRRVGAR